MSAAIDYAAGGEAAYTGGDAWGVLPADAYDEAHVGPFILPAAQQQGVGGWESLIKFGIGRYIDNRFGPVNLAGNTQAGSFGGQSGATIGQRPINAGGGIARPGSGQPVGQDGMGGNMLLLIAAGVVAFMALS